MRIHPKKCLRDLANASRGSLYPGSLRGFHRDGRLVGPPASLSPPPYPLHPILRFLLEPEYSPDASIFFRLSRDWSRNCKLSAVLASIQCVVIPRCFGDAIAVVPLYQYRTCPPMSNLLAGCFEPTTYVNRRKRTRVEIKQPRATPLFFFLANVWGDSSSPERRAKARCVENGTNAADVANEEVEAAGGIPFECVEGSEVEADGCLQNATVSGSDVSHHYNNMARQHT